MCVQFMTLNNLMVEFQGSVEYPLLLIPFGPGVVVPARVLSMGQIDLFDI